MSVLCENRGQAPNIHVGQICVRTFYRTLCMVPQHSLMSYDCIIIQFSAEKMRLNEFEKLVQGDKVGGGAEVRSNTHLMDSGAFAL